MCSVFFGQVFVHRDPGDRLGAQGNVPPSMSIRLFEGSEWQLLFPDTVVVLEAIASTSPLADLGVEVGCGVLTVNDETFANLDEFVELTQEFDDMELEVRLLLCLLLRSVSLTHIVTESNIFLFLQIAGVGVDGGLECAPVTQSCLAAERAHLLHRVRQKVRLFSFGSCDIGCV